MTTTTLSATHESDNSLARTKEPMSQQQKRLLGLLMVGALSVGAVGIATAGDFSPKNPNQGPEAVAKTLEKGLNGSKHVVQGAKVEVGYEVPIEPGKGPEGAAAIVNPIKLGKNTYAYIDYDSNGGQEKADGIKLHPFAYTGKLQPAMEGGYNKAYAHEVITPLSVVEGSYNYPNSSYFLDGFSVLMSAESGDINKMVVNPNDTDTEMGQQAVLSQLSQILEGRVGQLRYEGK